MAVAFWPDGSLIAAGDGGYKQSGNVRIDNANRISYSGTFFKVSSTNKIADFEYYTTTNDEIVIKNNVFDTVDIKITLIGN